MPGDLCAAQEGQWEYMCSLAPDDPGDARVVVVDNRYLDGAVDPAVLQRALVDVTTRHDGLRLAFDAVAIDPSIAVRGQVEPPVEFLDLTALDERRQRDRLAEIVFGENRRRFDLRAGPPWHAWVVRLGARRFFVSACFSHIVADGWACQVFMRDLLGAYAARTGDAAPPAGDAPTLAELRALQARRLEPRPERLRYWRERLLPLRRHASPPQPVDPGADLLTRHAVDFHFAPRTVLALRRVAWRARTTPFCVLLAAYHLLLSTATGTERTVVSTATFGRPTDAERKAVFQCVSDPYVATTLPEACSLHDAVVATHEALTAGARNLVPFTALARAVKPDFDAARPWADFNLCDGNFYSGAFEDSDIALGGIRARPVPFGLTEPLGYVPELVLGDLAGGRARAWTANCGPSVEIGEQRDRGRVLYNRTMYTDGQMRALVRQYLWMVEALTCRTQATVGAVREQHARRFPAPALQNDSTDAP